MDSPVPLPSGNIGDLINALFDEIRRTHITSYAQGMPVTSFAGLHYSDKSTL